MSELTASVQSAIDRFNSGDPKALNDIFSRSADRLSQIARRMLHGSFERVAAKEETADVVSEAVLRLLRALTEVRVGSPTEFLRLSARMMRRALLDLARHHYGPEGSAANQVHMPTAGGSSAPTFEPSAGSSHDPAALAAWGEFHKCVDALPDELLAVFDLLWYEDLTQDEAASLLKVSVPTVKRRWRDAKLALIECLGNDLPGGFENHLPGEAKN